MKSIYLSFFGLVLAACFTFGAWAQQNTSSSSIDNDFVKKTFGEDCTVNAGVQAQVADFDGDGVDDIVIPARCTNPMENTAEHKYSVIDPSMAFYGLSDPHITTQFSTMQPEQRSLALLIIHGTGKDAWKAGDSKAKFLVVNLAYKNISAKKFQIKKKKTVEAVYVEELGEDQMTSVIFWDGKKYKYQPLGTATQ